MRQQEDKSKKEKTHMRTGLYMAKIEIELKA